MAQTIKEIFAANLLTLLERHAGAKLNRAQAVTALVNLGIPTGTAQRLIDDRTNVQINTVELVAGKFRVAPASLLTPHGAQTIYSDEAKAFAAWFDALPQEDKSRAILFRDMLFRPGINPTNIQAPGQDHSDEPDSDFDNLEPPTAAKRKSRKP